MSKTAVVLLSGGIDSATCLGIAKDQGFDIVAISFDYNQRHKVELEAAKLILQHYGITKHYIFNIGLFQKIGGSALTDTAVPVPQSLHVSDIGEDIPVTYVPARNMVFLSYALGVAEQNGADDIFIGVNALDYSGYPDCRPEFIESFAKTANLAIKSGVQGSQIQIHTPLIKLTKSEIISRGNSLGVPYHLTHSCYSPTEEGLACRHCDACLLRRQGFEDAGLVDPTRYHHAA